MVRRAGSFAANRNARLRDCAQQHFRLVGRHEIPLRLTNRERKATDLCRNMRNMVFFGLERSPSRRPTPRRAVAKTSQPAETGRGLAETGRGRELFSPLKKIIPA